MIEFKDWKTVYKFKPFKHWNYITDCQYDILVRFYGEEMLRTEQEENDAME